MMNPHWIFDRITAHNNKPFLAHNGTVATYADLAQEIKRVEAACAGAVPPGAAVALPGDYSTQSIAALLWLFQNKNIIVPMTASTEVDMTERMEQGFCSHIVDCRAPSPKLTVMVREQASGTHDLLEKLRKLGHAGLVLFSSGSAGKPKAMIHDLTNLVEVYADRKSRNLSMIIFLMFDHIGGINTLFNSLASGSFMVAPSRRNAEEVAGLIAKYRVSILPTTPTFLNLLLLADAHRTHDLSSLKIITYGTEPMPESLLIKLREAFPKVRFLQTFGTSETGISRTDSKSSGSLFMKLDDPDIEHKVVDGELWLRSKTQILGYLNHSMDSFTPDGWFRTGDKVEVDDAGYIRIIGRAKEMINVGGEKVTPAEVESVILEVPSVADCTVYGQPSPITGQIVAAKVALKAGASAPEAKSAIRAHCAAKLARYKIPVKITFVDAALFGERFKKKRA
jgi:acyl-coenzyme A synthetase/AMP-(fatty) acid ligase